jgi:hypothetical protein
MILEHAPKLTKEDYTVWAHHAQVTADWTNEPYVVSRASDGSVYGCTLMVWLRDCVTNPRARTHPVLICLPAQYEER